MTLQERMLEDYNKRNAEDTAETIADTPKEGASEGEGGFISNFYDTVKEVVADAGEGISSAAEMAGNAWDQGFEWNPGKEDHSANMERIMSDGADYSEQTFPPPVESDDWASKNEKHRARQAAKANNISNTQHKGILEKNLSREEQRNLEQFGKSGLSLNLKRLMGDNAGRNVDAYGNEIGVGRGPDEPKAQYDGFDQDPRSYDYPERGPSRPRNTGGAYDIEEEVGPETVTTASGPMGKRQTWERTADSQMEPSVINEGDPFEQAPSDYEGVNTGKDPDWSQEDDNEGQNVVQEEMKQLNETIIKGTPEEKEEATEFRKKIFAHLPPRERALAKEETGNYWVDPISGVAINIDAIEADGKRKSNWLMIDKLPEHARPYFMAKFGYLDEEDVDGMPIDPKLKIAEMNVQAKKLELESLEKRHTESTGVQYAQITGKSELHASNLKWEREKYNGLSKAQQEELQIKQYTQVRSNVDMLFKNGQYEAGMLLGQGLGIPYVMDMKGFWRSKAKTTDIDPVFGMALKGSGLEGLSAKAAGTKYYDTIGDYWSKLNKPNTDPDMKSSYFEVKARKHGHRLWGELNDDERKTAGNPMLHHNTVRSKLLTELMGKDPRFGTLHTNLNDARATAGLGDRGDGGTSTGTGKKGPPKSKKLTNTSTKLTKKTPDLSGISPVKGLEGIDTKFEFGSEKYTGELEGQILGLGNIDWDEHETFMDWRNSTNGLQRIKTKNLGPKKIKEKLAKAYKTGKKGFEEILAKQKGSSNPKFTSIEEAAVYYNKKAGPLGDKRHYVRNDVKYYISRNLK